MILRTRETRWGGLCRRRCCCSAPLLSRHRLLRHISCRHFASSQVRLDVLGTAVGALCYLALMRQLWGLARLDLVAAAAGCVVVALWPLLLSRWARPFYLANRRGKGRNVVV